VKCLELPGLALIDAIGRLRNIEPLQVRIGIGTGLVVVGDLVGSGDSQEREVVGETPNLAARLQAIAPPNTMVIGPRTRRLLAELFEYQDLGCYRGERVQGSRPRLSNPPAELSGEPIRGDAHNCHASGWPRRRD
jgi:class 3 adenylate cyclase